MHEALTLEEKTTVLQVRQCAPTFSFTTSLVLGSTLLGSTASAQWTVTRLSPPDAVWSQARAATGGQQAGVVFLDGMARASLWTGTASSWVDLSPAGSTLSFVNAARGGQQAGVARIADSVHASLWSGSAGSWVDLNPSGSIASEVFGMADGQQGGYAHMANRQSASLWTGTAESWVNLHPPHATQSVVHAVSGGRQVGYAVVGGASRASLWSGTAASWVDLNPVGSTDSRAYAVHGGQQGGLANVGGTFRASLWGGTAASWIDLTPTGATEGFVFAIGEGHQAGYVSMGWHRASLWSGTAASWVDLDQFLSPGTSGSYATSVSSVGAVLYVTGYRNAPAGSVEAVLWTLCRTPSITSQPIEQLTCSGGSVQFVIVAQAFEAATYQWQWQLLGDTQWNVIAPGINSLAGVPQFEAIGSVTGRVSLRPPIGPSGTRQWPNQGYRVRAIVGNSCGSATSSEVALTICAADFNCDGFLDFFDYDDFVTAFETGGGLEADFNRDGFVDFFDYDEFVLAFENGC